MRFEAGAPLLRSSEKTVVPFSRLLFSHPFVPVLGIAHRPRRSLVLDS